MPAISVIVPVYQAERLLPQCVESVLGQTFSDWELLLVDDGSRDGSPALCDAYAAGDARVRVFHKPNGGVSTARNLGLEQATGPYIAFLDADDTFEPAALETLSENLSDGVIAPMFWFALLGLPGMMAYKMVNTLDSMIGYKNERYLEFGRIAALIDDIANYIPARLTAYLMLLVSNNWGKRDFVRRFGPEHASPNSGYPEAALAAVLDCQFGGTHDYFGKPVEKPYIGTNARPFTTEDMRIAIQVNSNTELLMGVIVTLILLII